MISWEKELKMRIKYLTASSRRNASTELHLRYVQHDDRINNPMEINIPGTDDWITVDAEFLKKACDKALDMRRI